MTDVNVLFMDKETEDGLGWGEIWAMYSPLTPYGLAVKSAMQPYRPGQEAQLRGDFAQLRQDAQALRYGHTANPLTQHLEEMLRELPDIRPSLQTLSQNGVLGMKDILSLKKFIWNAWPYVQESSTFTFTSAEMWTNIRELYGWDTEPSLSIESIGGERIREASQAYGAALAQRAKTDKAASDKWMVRTGYRPTRDGQLVIPMPQGREVANALKTGALKTDEVHALKESALKESALKADTQKMDTLSAKDQNENPPVEWVRDTPFESVFEVMQTDEQRAATAQVEIAKRELAAAEDEVFRLFSVELRNRLQTLKAMVADIANLDVRLAKVRLLERFGGCVPDVQCAPDVPCALEVEGDKTVRHPTLYVQGAVHPLAKRQRESHGASFHPFDWSLSTTLNVLCGPNMGGKTVAMQTWCILQALVQYGLPVPAKCMRTRLFDAIRFTSSAETNVHLGLSAFGREMVRIAEVAQLVSQTPSAIVCFDEPCRSTNPIEGEALASALAAYFRDELHGQGLCILTTHYTGVLRVPGASVFEASGWDEALVQALAEELGESPDAQSRLDNLDWRQRLDAVQAMTKHTIKAATGSEVHSFAIRTAELLGVPPAMVERARVNERD